jgi:hypothetical protein
MVLACNRPEAAETLLATLHWEQPQGFHQRLASMLAARDPCGLEPLKRDPAWLAAGAVLAGCAAA